MRQAAALLVAAVLCGGAVVSSGCIEPAWRTYCAANDCSEGGGSDGGAGGGKDGGTDGGRALDSGLVVDAGAGVDGGDAGPVVDAGPPAITWTALSSQPNVQGNTLHAVDGTSASDVWVTGAYGRLHHYDGTGWAQVFQAPAGAFDLEALWVSPDGGVFAGGQGNAFSCLGGCTDRANHVYDGGYDWFHGMCGLDSTHVYGVAEGVSRASFLYAFDGLRWAKLNIPAGLPILRACWVSPSGEVFLVGDSATVLRYPGGVTPEVIDWPNGTPDPQLSFAAIHGVGSVVFAAGTGGKVYSRGDAGHWTLATTLGSGNDLSAVAAASPQEFYAGGGYPPNNVIRFNGALSPPRWQASPGAAGISITSMWAASPDLYFAVGFIPSQLPGVVVVGNR